MNRPTRRNKSLSVLRRDDKRATGFETRGYIYVVLNGAVKDNSEIKREKESEKGTEKGKVEESYQREFHRAQLSPAFFLTNEIAKHATSWRASAPERSRFSFGPLRGSCHATDPHPASLSLSLLPRA